MSIREIARRFFSKPFRRCALPRFDGRARLEVTALEDRTVPTVVSVISLGDIAEGGAANAFQFTRSDLDGDEYPLRSSTGTSRSLSRSPDRPRMVPITIH